MQKFNNGDYVRVAKDLGPCMAHFQNDCDAIIIGSYADQYGGKNRDSFTIFIKGSGKISWYYGSQLALIESNRKDLLAAWQEESDDEHKKKSDLDWIFSNGKEVLKHPNCASVQALADCFGLTNLWGRRGEGFVCYQNMLETLQMAEPFLEASDKAGWLEHCKMIVANAVLSGATTEHSTECDASPRPPRTKS